ncbi:DUF6455 family protein [Ancylobacter sp. FA202]|uniref:DUF6455 family protein n=1 Tax=Ancylobacter sp. FA202 TaxID=1111106 RepID=UPI00037E4D68|nr:DUF6455 family protein [Ancylobacter sp. FA202]
MNVDTIDERLALFRAMAAHAGVDLPAIAAEAPQEVLAAAQRCLGCRDAPDCHRWFDAQAASENAENASASQAPVPGFCRNATQFDLWKDGETPSQAGE